MTAGDETEAAKVRAALAQLEGRSPLHDWLRRNRAEMEAHFAVGRTRWASVARMLDELGVRDAKGEPPSPTAVRRAWGRLRAAQPAPAPVAVVAPTVAVPGAQAPPVRPPAFDPREGKADAITTARAMFPNLRKATPR